RYSSMKEFAAALVRTPEGRKARTRISSISDEDSDERSEVRIENSRYPKPPQGADTAMFGSAGEGSVPPPADEPIDLPRSSSKVGLTIMLLAAAGAAVGGYFAFGKKEGSGLDTSPSGVHERAVAPPVVEKEDESSSAERDAGSRERDARSTEQDAGSTEDSPVPVAREVTL